MSPYELLDLANNSLSHVTDIWSFPQLLAPISNENDRSRILPDCLCRKSPEIKGWFAQRTQNRSVCPPFATTRNGPSRAFVNVGIEGFLISSISRPRVQRFHPRRDRAVGQNSRFPEDQKVSPDLALLPPLRIRTHTVSLPRSPAICPHHICPERKVSSKAPQQEKTPT
jgi:hypothetical protein